MPRRSVDRVEQHATVGVAPTAGLVLLGRYVLDDRIGGSDDAPTWRGTDTRLRRAVSIQTLALADPRVAALRDGARLAAAFDDRRAIPVLDFGSDAGAELLVVVSEWVSAVGYGDHIRANSTDRLSPSEAADVSLELARCLFAAHAQGVGHGCLHPNSVLITDGGEVRLRGLGIARVLQPAGDYSTIGATADPPTTVAADINGIGSILYAGLTGRWPGGRTGTLPAAARLPGGALPWPSRVVADVPTALDDIVARSVGGCSLPKGRAPFTDVAALTTALTAAVDTPPQVAPVATRRQGPNIWRRALGIGFGLALALTLAIIGIHLASGTLTKAATSTNESTIGLGVNGSTGTPSGSASPTVPKTNQTVIAPVVVLDFNPYGSDQHENPGLVPLATDGDPTTAWTTLDYSSPTMSGKRGVGLRLDLGTPRTFSSVSLVLVGNGTTLELRAGDNGDLNSITPYKRVALAILAPGTITLRIPGGVTARYLVVWLKQLPPSGNGFKGGIAEVRISN
jgi:putative peptidoglycan lipid II flippase